MRSKAQLQKRALIEDYANYLVDAVLHGNMQDAEFCIDYLRYAQRDLAAIGHVARMSDEGKIVVETFAEYAEATRRKSL